MSRSLFLKLTAAMLCICAAAMPVFAAETDGDCVYCFSDSDFSENADELCGICITSLPDAACGTVTLGSRIIRAGDILTRDQVARMTFCPASAESDALARVGYLPIYETCVEPEAEMTISIRGKQDKAPIAEDSALETYKNLENEGCLRVTDPEGSEMTFAVIRQPRRGTVEIRSDGSFTYTPKKNKVGTDSFTFTATDAAGNVSREATVTIQIRKPTDSRLYTDTLGSDCRFAAEWMRNTGIFAGEAIRGQLCFSPEREVTRGEFLSMVMNALEIPTVEASATGFDDEAPDWLKPYLAAALRSGLVGGYRTENGLEYKPNQSITAAEAAVILQNALDLAVQTTAEPEDEAIPVWARTAGAALTGSGIPLYAGSMPLTRAEAAKVLYAASQIAEDAPGLAVFRMQ